MANVIILKNQTVSDISVAGILLPGSGQIDISEIDLDDLAFEGLLEADILAGDILVNDGATDLTTALDGVAHIFGSLFDNFLFLGNPPQIFITDPTRGDKNLSADSTNFIFSTSSVNANTWLQVSHVSDADSGFIMPFDGTIVHATAHCENTNANSNDLEVWINAANIGSVGTLAGGLNVIFNNTIVNMDFAAGDRVRLRGAAAGSKIEDTVSTLWVKWRA